MLHYLISTYSSLQEEVACHGIDMYVKGNINSLLAAQSTETTRGFSGVSWVDFFREESGKRYKITLLSNQIKHAAGNGGMPWYRYICERKHTYIVYWQLKLEKQLGGGLTFSWKREWEKVKVTQSHIL